jgi:hypothetical protein
MLPIHCSSVYIFLLIFSLSPSPSLSLHPHPSPSLLISIGLPLSPPLQHHRRPPETSVSAPASFGSSLQQLKSKDPIRPNGSNGMTQRLKRKIGPDLQWINNGRYPVKLEVDSVEPKARFLVDRSCSMLIDGSVAMVVGGSTSCVWWLNGADSEV